MPTNPAGASGAAAGNAPLSPRGIASVLSRFQGSEQFYTQPFAALSSPIIPRNIPLARPLESIEVTFYGRVTIGVANYTTVAAEAPTTILQRIRLTGTHRTFNQLIPIDLSGATAFVWPRLFQQKGNTLKINGVIQPDPSEPYQQQAAVFGNIGTYDLEIHYVIPFAPVFGPNGRRAMNYFLLQPTDWADTLQLQLFFGDASSFGTPGGGTTVTFSAYGSDTGSPNAVITTNYAILGPMANKVQSAVVIRNEQTVIAQSLAAVAQRQRLALLQKQKTTNLLVKTGTQLAGTSAGVLVFQSLSDDILEATQVIVDNKPIRNNFFNRNLKEYNARMFNTVVPEGYLNITWIESQTPLTAFQANTSLGGSTFELDSDVVQAASSNLGLIVQEQILGSPRGKA